MIKTALRNLGRNKRRTILTFSILSVGIIYYIVIQGMLDGFELESIRNFINLESGHLKITASNYNPETFENRIQDFPGLEAKLLKYPFIKAVSPRLKLVGTLDNGIDLYPVVIVGIDPPRDTMVFELEKYCKDPQLEGNGLWIGSEIARKFSLKQGDFVYLTFKGKKDAIISREFQVQGIIDSPSFINNNVLVYAHLKTLDELGGFNGEISEVIVLTDRAKNVGKYKEILSGELPGLEIKTWVEEGRDFLSISQAKRSAQFLLIFFIIIIGIIGTTNTLLIGLYERIQEIGTLKALGMTDTEVMKLFILEGILIGVAGSVFGILTGVIINYFFAKYGTNWSYLLPKDMNWGYRVAGVVKSSWNLTSIWLSLLLGPASTFGASYIPARKARQLTPAECLRWI